MSIEEELILPYQRWVFDDVVKRTDPHNKRFLEIGGVPAHRSLARAFLDLGAAEVVQINSREDLPESAEGGLTYLPRDARKTHFGDESFDVIYGASVLEHLQKLPEIFAESYRIICPGGFVCVHGGALWSSHWDHHVWVHMQDVRYEFNGNNPVPDWGHLYLSRPQMSEYLVEQGVPAHHSESICDWIYLRQDLSATGYQSLYH